MKLFEVIAQLNAYADIIKGMSLKRMSEILMAYGSDAITTFIGLPDEGEGMTKEIYFNRKEICYTCPLRTKMNTCDPTKKRIHVSMKKEDGSSVWVNGCGCGLQAKQKTINEHCPAGEW